jgi:antitoxin ParD1/3/4
MNLILPTDADAFIRELVAQGRYQSEADAVAAGVRLLMQQEQLRDDIQAGIEQLDRGDFSEEDAVFSEIESAIASSQAHE